MSYPRQENLSLSFNKLTVLPTFEEIYLGLQAKQALAQQAYLEEHQTPQLWNSGIRQAIWDIGITAIAKEALGLRPPVSRAFIPGSFWLLYEREDMKKFIEADTAQRGFLLDTVFFKENRMLEKYLTCTAYGAIHESKNYPPYEFAARVSTGEVVARPYSESYVPTSLGV